MEREIYAINVEGLEKQYGNNRVVRDLTFHVRKGELFALLGENGAGKTTTISMICTFLESDGGSISILGYDVKRDPQKVHDSIGVVFQQSILDAQLTVRDNLYSRGSFYGMTRKKIEDRLRLMTGFFEVDEIMDRKYGLLSGGQKRRVDILRALINDPDILFLDEPTAGLDPRSRRKLWECIRWLKEEKGLTIVLTTHYLEETEQADDVLILDHGGMVAAGSPAELKRRYTSSRLLWYCDRKSANDEILDAAGYTYRYEKDHYSIRFTGSVTEFLFENRDRIREYEVIKGSMDDVFLELTGKEYGDDGNSWTDM